MSWISYERDEIVGELAGVSIRPARDHSVAGNTDLFIIDVDERHYLVSRVLAEIVQSLRVLPARPTDCAAAVGRAIGIAVTADQIVDVLNRFVRPMIEGRTKPPARSGFLFRRELIGEPLVNAVVAPLTLLYRRRIRLALILLLALTLPALVLYAIRNGIAAHGARDLTIAIAVYVATGVVHELGHAAALKHFGERPGPIGFGLYLFIPAFYSDVTKAWRLSRRGRIAVDLGGVYFQALCIPVLWGIAAATGLDCLLLSCWLILGALVFNLSPLLRLDGHWLLLDLLGTRDAAPHLGAALRRMRDGAAPSRTDALGMAFFFGGGGLYLYWMAHSLYLLVGSALAGLATGIALRPMNALHLMWTLAIGGLVAGWTVRRLAAMARAMRAGVPDRASIPQTPHYIAARRASWQDMEAIMKRLPSCAV